LLAGDLFPLEKISLMLEILLAFEHFVWVVLRKHYLKVVKIRLVENVGIETHSSFSFVYTALPKVFGHI
jgi:hypothetical protein